MVVQNFGGTEMSIMVNLNVGYLPPFSLHRTEHRTVSCFILVPVPHSAEKCLSFWIIETWGAYHLPKRTGCEAVV